MAFKCYLCGKGPVAGNNRSHSNRATRRVFRPNLQQIRFPEGEQMVSKLACTTCIRTLSKTRKPRAPRKQREPQAVAA